MYVIVYELLFGQVRWRLCLHSP